MILVDCFQRIPANVSSSKEKEVSSLEEFEYEAGKLAAFKKRSAALVFWQVMQCRRSGAFLTWKAAGCDSSCC